MSHRTRYGPVPFGGVVPVRGRDGWRLRFHMASLGEE